LPWGNQVFLKLQPCVQTSLSPHSSQKLPFKFFGPYTILSRVGEVTYKLYLSATSKIHNVVHVSQLKHHLPVAQPVSDDLALLSVDNFAVLQPSKVLARRIILRGGGNMKRVQVRWLGLPISSITWEDAAAMHARFPSSMAWGQASSQDGGNVTTKPVPRARDDQGPREAQDPASSREA
jgi:hypothetical protein